MHVFNTKDKNWTSYNTSFPKANSRTNQYYPKAGAASVLVGGNLYIFGGRDSKGKLDNRLCVLNLDKRTWKIDVDTPNPNAAHITP